MASIHQQLSGVQLIFAFSPGERKITVLRHIRAQLRYAIATQVISASCTSYDAIVAVAAISLHIHAGMSSVMR